MNWYKESQQNLLFYPWDRHPSSVEEDAKPSYIDPNTGQSHYRCGICGEDVLEENISDWYASGEKIKYKYPVNDLNTDDVRHAIDDIMKLLVPYFNAYDEAEKVGTAEAERLNALPENQNLDLYSKNIWRKTDFNMPAPDLAQACNSDAIKSYIRYFTYTNGMHNWSKELRVFRTLNEIAYDGTIDGNQIETLRYDPNIFGAILFGIPDFNNIAKEIEIRIKKPVCPNCEEEADICIECDEKIYPSENEYYSNNSYETVSGNKVCQKCVEKGRMSICAGCGLADNSDDMSYVDDEGDYCSACYEKIEKNYDEHHRDKVENLAKDRKHPFSSWFSKGDREYVPFVTDGSVSTNDNAIMDHISSSELNGEKCYTDLKNYQDGYAFCGKRKYRIGKLFDIILRNTFERIDSWKGYDEGTREDAKRQAKTRSDYLKKEFEGSKFRAMKSKVSDNLMVVISKDPHDIAQMSTGRKWTSCMNISKPNGREHDVYCEVEDGGVIAYLTEKNDKEIQDPIARLLIRRYENEEGQSVAVPEERIYGETRDEASFKNTVQKWVDSKQGKIPKGSYDIKGMPYTDRLGEKFRIAKKIFDNLIKLAGKNWYKVAQFVPQKAKGKVSPIPEWQREDSDKVEQEIYPGVYQQPKGSWYTDIGHDVMTFNAIMWFIDTDYKIHILDLSSGDYEEDIEAEWMAHENWREFNQFDDKLLASGRYESKPDDPSHSKLSLVFHESDRFHHGIEYIDKRRIYDILRENFPNGTKIQVYKEL